MVEMKPDKAFRPRFIRDAELLESSSSLIFEDKKSIFSLRCASKKDGLFSDVNLQLEFHKSPISVHKPSSYEDIPNENAFGKFIPPLRKEKSWRDIYSLQYTNTKLEIVDGGTAKNCKDLEVVLGREIRYKFSWLSKKGFFCFVYRLRSCVLEL
jgi:hypothetical protein